MDEKSIAKVNDFLASRVTAFGFAPVERFAKAPERHHPANICKDAKAVVVFAIASPRGMLRSPEYGLHAMHRSYHTIYSRLDDIAVDLCNFIEQETGGFAVPVPAYAPMVFEEMEPWGILSLKHAAVNAGLGAIGRNGLLHNQKYGTMLRLGAVVTDTALPGSALQDHFPCKEKCNACHQACPSGALQGKGEFNKMTCLGHTIQHAFYPLAFKDPENFKQIDLIVNTAGYNYWLTCNQCIRVCPNNRTREQKSMEAAQ